MKSVGLFLLGVALACPISTASAVSLDALCPSQRIITPNGDGINDLARFGAMEEGARITIFDAQGREMRHLTGGPAPIWDGRDDSGQRVESGVYLYQLSSELGRTQGVVLVAR